MKSAISVQGITKRFRIPLDHSSTLKYRVLHPRSSSRYRDLLALNNISFEVPAGQFLGITGPNGCGKSTLLKVLSDIYRADSGTVEIDGEVSPFLELGVGFNPELTARENIFLGGSVIGLTRRDLRTRVDGILHFAELEDFADQKIKNFSSGMQVRLAFSVAIQADAGILLMDEVLAVGDARFQEKCFDVFADYKRDGRTVVLVTHDLSALERYCDRVLLMTNGELIGDGTPDEVTATYRRMVSRRVETDDQEAEAGVEAPPQNRWGSREVEISDIRMHDSSGVAHSTFTSGESVSIEIDYLINDVVDEFACAVRLKRSDGLELGVATSRRDGYRIPGPPVGTTGTLRYEIPDLPLLDGSYTLSASLGDAQVAHIFDHIENAVPFRVADDKGREGLLMLSGTWHDSTVENRPVVKSLQSS